MVEVRSCSEMAMLFYHWTGTEWACFRARTYVLDYLYAITPFSDDLLAALICYMPHYDLLLQHK